MNAKRLGAIIRNIGGEPGITMSGLLTKLNDQGYDITERTLAKDINLLKSEFELLPPKDRLRSGYFLQNVYSLGTDEIGMVLDAMQVFAVQLNDQEAASLMDRLTTLASEWKDTSIARARNTRTVRQRDIYQRRQAQIQQTLLTAIRSRLPVRFTYNTPRAEGPKQVRGYPIFLIFHERGWYCITRDMRDANFYPRRIDRMQECEVLQRSAVNDDHENNLRDAQFLVSCGWGMMFPRNMADLRTAEKGEDIVVRFDRTVAPFILESVERHPRGKVARARDGSGDVLFHVKLAEPAEFLNWVRAFGSRAKVMAPPKVVESERAEIRRMATNYGI